MAEDTKLKFCKQIGRKGY